MKDFKKSDLENCMVVEYRDGSLRLVAGDILVGKVGSMSLDDYNDNLVCKSEYDGLDIVKIYNKIYNLDALKIKALDLLWERHEVKEVTMAEVEEKFGCKVKIVKE